MLFNQAMLLANASQAYYTYLLDFLLNTCEYSKRWIVDNRIGGVMVNVLTSTAVDRGFGPRSSQTKHYTIDICCFSAKHAALRRKSKDWLAWNQDTVSEWRDMSICGLLFRWTNTIKNPTKRVGLVQSGPHHHLFENELVLATYVK